MSFNQNKLSGLIVLLLICGICRAQQNTEQQIAELLESVSQLTDEHVDYAELLDRLNHYRAHPLNLNRATEEELKDFGLLSPFQLQSLIKHRSENGSLIDLLELQGLEHFDLLAIHQLLPFVSIGLQNPLSGIDFSDLLGAKHDLLCRYQQDLQKKNAYRVSDSSASRYLGSAQHITLRYRYYFNKQVSAALNLEKDAGEYLYSKKAGVFDYQSGHLSFKAIGAIKKIIIGDYDLQFGQGLSLWSGLSFGKSSAIQAIVKPEIGLKPYSSFNEGLFFRGIATSLGLGAFRFTPFYSIRKLDASLDENSAVTSLNFSGLHRTQTEIDKKNNLKANTYGGIVEWKLSRLNIGLLAFKTAFDKSFASKEEPYQLAAFDGKTLINYGLTANYTLRNSYFFGEIAKNSMGDPAFLTGVLSSLSPRVSLGLVYRCHPQNYLSFYNSALSESSTPKNERGLFSIIQIKFNRRWEWTYYADVFVFPWLKFGVDAPSKGYELSSQLSYQPSKRVQLIAVYKVEQKEENADSEFPLTSLATHQYQKIRFDLRYWPSKIIQIRNRLEMVQLNSEKSYLTFQEFHYKPLQAKLSFNFRFTLFNIPSYSTRIYAYQPDVLYQTSIKAFQDKGMQFLANARYRIQRGLDCWLNYV
ncbi:MAG: hypothetical protein RI924_1514 [Bacteroidota bacterium]|jgi:hypothetical protein